MVMRAQPRKRSTLPRLRFSFRCRVLKRHDLDFYRIWGRGETWNTFLFVCRRCNRVTGNSHAARSYYPVDPDEVRGNR